MFKNGDRVIVVHDDTTALNGYTGTIKGFDSGYRIKFDKETLIDGPFHENELDFVKNYYLDQFYALLTETR